MKQSVNACGMRPEPPDRSCPRRTAARLTTRLRLPSAAALWLCLTLFLLSACGRQKASEEVQRIEELCALSDSLQRADTDSAIRLERQALEALQTVHNDSLRTAVLIKLGTAYSIKGEIEQSDSCFEVAERAALRYANLAAELYIDRGINRDKRGDVDSAIALYDQAYLQVRRKMPPDKRLLIRIDNNRGISYQRRGKFDLAMESMQRSLQTAEELGDNHSIADALMNMGNTRYRMRDAEQADSLFRQADAIYASLGDVRQQIAAKSNRIVALANLGLHDKALAVSLDAERLADSIGAKEILGSIYNNRGKIYFDQKDYPRSLSMARRALEIKEQLGDTLELIASFNSMASVYIEMGNYAEAIRYATEALQRSEEKNTLTYREDIYDNLATAHGRSGDYPAAVSYFEQKDALRDTLFTRDKYAAIEEMRARYETVKKDHELQIAALDSSRQRTGIAGLAALCVVLTGGFAYIHYTQRRKLRQYVRIARQGDRVDELTEQTLAPQCGSDESEQSAVGLSEEKGNELLRALRSCMEEHALYRDPSLTLEALAIAIGTNRSYLSILINSRMKKGFSEYLNFYRLREAKRLPRESDDKVAVIAEAAGFGTQQSFYSAFRSAEQPTPTQYRKAARTGK